MKQRVAGRGREDEQPPAKIRILQNFASCEISQVAKIRRTQNFENSQVKFDSPWNTCNKTRPKIIRN